MSAQLAKPGPYEDDEEPDAYYIAYSGPYDVDEQATYAATRYALATGQPFTAFVARCQAAVPPVREDLFASRDRDTITERERPSDARVPDLRPDVGR
jgi:hypothetical protein